MRKKKTGFVTVRAISGTYAVFLAMNMDVNDARGLMGFAISRTSLDNNEVIWLRGNKTFEALSLPSGLEDANSHDHPFQSFQWADYTVQPDRHYRYKVIPLYGDPGQLKEKTPTELEIKTEALTDSLHEIHFNRSAIASQAFVRHFAGQSLDQAGRAAYEWLGRDLVPALLAFIAKANGPGFQLYAAIYEVEVAESDVWPNILHAFKKVADSGAELHLLCHGVADRTGTMNRKLMNDMGIGNFCTFRANAKLMHNKFIVLCQHGRPLSVWTGSANLTRSGLFGQLNVGHAIHDPDIATTFLKYWQELFIDPPIDAMRAWMEENNPLPTNTSGAMHPFFSPHKGRKVFDWWIKLAESGKPLFMTFPFGIVKGFRQVFDHDDGILRFALLDKYTNGGDEHSRTEVKADIERIRRLPNVGMALGNHIFVDWIDGWHKESEGLGVHVHWIHSKFMLVDPLGEHPLTLTGSANFSLSSVNENDENMVLIRDNQRVADIYFTEFMRLFAHHRFRESVERHIRLFGNATINNWKPQFLFTESAKWVDQHFFPGSEYDIKRRYFAGI